jgi:hypothetical protein
LLRQRGKENLQREEKSVIGGGGEERREESKRAIMRYNNSRSKNETEAKRP